MPSRNPLIIQSDMTILAEVDPPRHAEARDRLARFAELVKMPEHVHTYRLTPLSLWNACAAGIAVGEIIQTLIGFAKFLLPSSVEPQLRETASRFGSLRLVREADGTLVLHVLRPGLADEFAAHLSLTRYLGERLAGDAFRVDPPWREPLRRALVKLGWPVEDHAGFADGAPLAVALRAVCRSGAPLVLRDYQDDAACCFTGGCSAGAGVVVLPCGGGKTIVAIACITRLATHTLILATSVTAARQWRDELLDKTTLTEDDIGEFSGSTKEIKPITIATYQVLTHRRKRKIPASNSDFDNDPDGPSEFSHFDLFDSHPWGLIVYDEVHLLLAPLFQAAASVQSRRRLGLTVTLVRENGMEGDVFALVGPKIHEVPWRILEGQGWIAPAVCTEIRIPLPERLVLDYHTAPPRQRPQVAAANPDKAAWVRALLDRHPGEPALVIGNYLESLQEIAAALDLPLLDGSTPQRRRDELFGAFRRGEIPTLAVSRIANFSIDLPVASVAVQISGQLGSREEEAQRLGRLLRPKAAGRRAWFYTLVTADTVEQDFALKRQLFLCEQGYEYRLHIARSAIPSSLSDLQIHKQSTYGISGRAMHSIWWSILQRHSKPPNYPKLTVSLVDRHRYMEVFNRGGSLHPALSKSDRLLAEIERRPEIDKLLKSIDCAPKNLRFHTLIGLMQICHAAGDVFAPDRNPLELGQYLVRHVLSAEAAREFNAKSKSGWIGDYNPLSGVELDLSRFASHSRLRSFLAMPPGEAGVRWESDLRQSSDSFHAMSMFTGKVFCGYAREILNRLVAAPGPLDLTSLLDDVGFDKKQVSFIAKALRGLCQYVFTLTACDSTGERLLIGLWPGLRALLRESPSTPLPPPPAAKAPATTFVAPFVCTDIAAVIVHAASKPILLKQTARLKLYAAEERKLAALLEEVPAWIGDGMFQTRVRATVAACAAAGFGWLDLHHRKLEFTASKVGRAWLALQPAARLENLLEQMRAAHWEIVRQIGASLPFSHVTGRVRRTASDHDILACEDGIAAAFHDVSIDAWTDTEAWLDYAARTRNPIVATVPLNDTTFELTAPLTTPQRRKLEAAGIFKQGT